MNPPHSTQPQATLDGYFCPKLTKASHHKNNQVNKLSELRTLSRNLLEQETYLFADLLNLQNRIKQFTIDGKSRQTSTSILEPEYIVYTHQTEGSEELGLVAIMLGRHSQILLQQTTRPEGPHSNFLKKMSRYVQVRETGASDAGDCGTWRSLVQRGEGEKVCEQKDAWEKYHQLHENYIRDYQEKMMNALRYLE